MNFLKTPALLVSAALLAGCSAMTTISTTQPGGTVAVASSDQTSAPRSESFRTTSFGNYEFKAQAPGQEDFYGILPLKFNGGYLALDILFFAPAAFFNLREVYPQYEFDLAKKHVKYRGSDKEEWSVFVPLSADEEQGKQAFPTAAPAAQR